jgi:hypothetical protein
MPKVFISYVHEDAPFVDQLIDDLKSAGVEVWLDRINLKPGDRWNTIIRQAIRSGDFFIACFSTNSINKTRSVMHRELLLAIDELQLRSFNQIWFIPVLLSKCNVPELDIGGGSTLQDIQYVPLFNNWDAGIENILNIILPDRKHKNWHDEKREKNILKALSYIE